MIRFGTAAAMALAIGSAAQAQSVQPTVTVHTEYVEGYGFTASLLAVAPPGYKFVLPLVTTATRDDGEPFFNSYFSPNAKRTQYAAGFDYDTFGHGTFVLTGQLEDANGNTSSFSITRRFPDQ